MSTFNDKRTRSQLTLPSLNPSVLGRSPLRDAKLAMRHAPNSQLQAHSKPRQPSKLRNNTSMDEEATDEEDEILLTPNKKLNSNRKRLSDEHGLAQDENGDPRESKRAKMGPSPGPSLAHTDTVHQPSPHLEQRNMDNIQRARSVDSPRGRSTGPSVRHVDLRTASSSPWRSSSHGSAVKMELKPKDAGAMEVDATPNLTPNLTPKAPSTPRPAPSTPVSHITPSITPCTPRSQTPQGLNLGLDSGRATGITGPMSPLTPVPPTPALFAGGPLRAFTLGRAGGQSKPLQRERSKMNIVTTNSDSAPSTPTGSSAADTSQLPHQSEHPEASSSNLPTSTSNPVISTNYASTASSTSTTTITTKHPRGHSRSRSAIVVSNGAGAWGPKPKTPSILKVQSMRGRGRGAVRGGGAKRVTRSVSMKEKMKESTGDNDGQSSGDAAGVRKSFTFTFKAPGLSVTDKSKTTNTSVKMKQMSMKDFIVGSSSSSTPTSSSTPSKALPSSGPSTGPSSPNKSKSFSTSPSKPKPAWNASAGSPFRLPPPSRPLKPASTLSTLSIALEKLSLPRPVRPNSSVGFNIDNGNKNDVEQKGTKDDGMVGLGTSVGGAKPLKRSATVGDKSSSSRCISGADGIATASRPNTTAPGANEAGKFPAKAGTLPSPTITPQVGPSVRPSGNVGNGGTKNNASLDRTFKSFGLPSRGSSIQGMLGSRAGGIVVGGGGGLARKVSKKTSLPSVIASPVKGSNGTPMEEDGIEEEPSEQADVSMRSTADISVAMNDVEEEGTGVGEKDKGKEKERPKDAWKLDASRRASMASQALTQSLSSLPRTPSKGSMGPPRTPGRAASFTYPSVASASKCKQNEETQAGGDDTGAGAVGIKSAPSVLGRVRSGSDGHVGTSRSARIFAQEKEAELEAAQNEEENEKGNGVLTLLNECVIFVDVRTDGGDDAGGLFVDMLKGMGARILTRVGPSCTHIVYKNGLMSTLTRYRLLQDPKPLVVGIGWVVECVEQRAHVDEARFNVDLDGVNVAGTNKRRRSMLPKLISGDESAETNESQEGESSRIDVSMDASEADSSMRSIDEEDLPPLEKARRRRLLLTGRA